MRGIAWASPEFDTRRRNGRNESARAKSRRFRDDVEQSGDGRTCRVLPRGTMSFRDSPTARALPCVPDREPTQPAALAVLSGP